MTEIKTNAIPHRLRVVNKNHPYVAGARDIVDDVKGKTQEQVNKETDDTFTLHQSEINALDSQNYYTVEATQADTTIASVMSRAGVIPQIDTVYRVGKWDGTQYDATVYSEYAYNLIEGSGEWKLLDVKSYGIDDEPTAGSDNLVKSGGVVSWGEENYGHYVDNPEFVRVYTDKDNRILWAIKADGTIYYGAGVPPQTVEYIQGKIAELQLSLDEKVDKEEGKGLIPIQYIQETENPEWIFTFLDSDRRIIGGFKKDGSFEFYKGIPTSIKEELVSQLNLKVDKVEGMGLINSDFASVISYLENPEWLNIILDSNDRICGGRRVDGSCVEFAGVVTPKVFADCIVLQRLDLSDKGTDVFFKKNYIIINPNPSYGEVFIGENNNHMAGPTNTKNILVGMHNINNAGIDEENNPFSGSGRLYPDRNVALGYHALFRGYVPKLSIAIGAESQDNVSYGSGNVSVGYSSLRCQRVQDYGGERVVGEIVYENTAIGNQCMYFVYGDRNTAIGSHALEGDTYGAKGSGNVAIGYFAGKYINDENDTLYIDNRDRGSRANETAKSLIVGKFADEIADQFLKINGKFSCNGATPQAAVTAAADATDLSSAITLLNQIKDALVACGIMKQ